MTLLGRGDCQMRVLGVGLGRTGTSTLHRALEILGLKSIHFDTNRLNDILAGVTPNPDFRRYDDIDAVTDIPSAYFFSELLEAYPESKAILTIRDINTWWKSISYHSNIRTPISKKGFRCYASRVLGLKQQLEMDREEKYDMFRILMRNYVYGSIVASEFLYKKKYVEHNNHVIATVPAKRLLIIDITAGDGWDKICPFLGMPMPSEIFPHENKSNFK